MKSEASSPIDTRPRIQRWSYIHSRVKELGFVGLSEYLAARYITEGIRVEDMAKECNVRVNTIRRHLRLHGYEVGTPRCPQPTKRKGTRLFCAACGVGKYYAPSIAKKLNGETYKCRSCKNDEFLKAREQS